MTKIPLVALSALVIAGSSIANAQDPAATSRMQDPQVQAASQALIERRIEVVRMALGLTKEQEKYWPAVEQAIRQRTTARHARLATVAARVREQRQIGPVELLRDRADALSQRAAGLKQLADAWQPLYQSLDENQKERLRVLTVYVLQEMRDRIASRMMELEDENEDQQ